MAKALVELRKKGVFASALVKKRRYWPKHIDGEMIRRHFTDKPVGAADAYTTTMSIDENGQDKIMVLGFKEPDYVLIMMSTYGTLARMGAKKNRRVTNSGGSTSTVEVLCPEPVHNHYKYRHAVDDHNNRRQHPISIERTWATNWWPHRVFSFLLSVSEINSLLAWTNIYGNERQETLDFRQELSGELINNIYLEEVSIAERRRRPASMGTGHVGLSIPKGMKFEGPTLVAANSQYPQKKCSGCGQKTRSYCSCSPGVYRCKVCLGAHYMQVGETRDEG